MKSIATKFLLPVVLLAAVFMALDMSMEYSARQEEVTELIDSQAALALAFDMAIRSYVAEEIRPAMEERTAPGEFIPETMSTSFVARSIFEKVRQSFPDYIIRFSSDDPRNPANRAGPDELRMIKYFNDNPDAKTWNGEIELDGRLHLAHFNARRMKESCLHCHGDPEDAPASLIERYGATAGFHRPVGEVIALDAVAIPMEKSQAAFMTSMRNKVVFTALGLTVLVVLIALVFRSVVARRLSAMRAHFERITVQPDSATMRPADASGNDEISALARSFNTMATKVRDARILLEQRVEDQTADLRESEERLQTILNTVQAGVVVIDEESHMIVEANPAALKMIRARREDVVGRVCHKFICPADVAHCPISDLEQTVDNSERCLVTSSGRTRPVLKTVTPVMLNGRRHLLESFVDLSERKLAEQALEQRIVSLTQPLSDSGNIALEDLFNLEDIQRLQDEFARATGVASIITNTDGVPITAPSNFCRLCNDIIRRTEKGCANCMKSDAVLGRHNPGGPIVQPCMSGGLWDAGAAISVDGQHVANWLIGQVRDETQTEEGMRAYAREIEADEDAVVEAFREVPAMSRERFGEIAQALFTVANQLSTSAYQNVQQARFIVDRRKAEEAAAANNAELKRQTVELEKSRRAAMSMMEDAEQARWKAEQAEEELRASHALMVRALDREKRVATELEAAMEQLEAAKQDAEAASQSKSEFLANMSHEIRTPMTAILGFTETMLDPKAVRPRRSSTPSIRSAATASTCCRLINDILDISKIEAGKLEIEHIRCSPVTTGRRRRRDLMRVRADARRPAAGDRIRWGPSPQTIESDPTRLQTDPRQPGWQRHQVHRRAGVRSDACQDACSHCNAAAYRPDAPVRCHRHRHRYDRRAGAALVPGLLAGRHVHHTQVRRHRAGVDDQQASGRGVGRHDHCRKQTGRGQRVPGDVLPPDSLDGVKMLGRPGQQPPALPSPRLLPRLRTARHR